MHHAAYIVTTDPGARANVRELSHWAAEIRGDAG
jgi:hypothetical protein